ncbi:MAG: type I-E CRISPR-associated protein Cse1/CasA [Rothia sp. (in: high G+C Gram-positive bacteria)]|uniref:type I-E CRISPR-associated protein Cse1/CasA n=1 Tax=Rothia sp. (in: high G+C Gram-positive bacteria) TaxID=1885016 RepID=UPI0026DFB137|nr:type I-E CRISPR-associated protein Cse1/CasA [Rothia sp. (in: high G+C Gram-positive bacteria)]MDO5750832.1 type I-E CRISPR-associated protein Cse1/CasA [Rothia sp. (in: high G+C Gram-positive bacteria)]
MVDSKPSFNLVDEPWIMVRGIDARNHEVSLRQLFTDAKNIERIDSGSAVQSTATFSLGLTVVVRSIVLDEGLFAGLIEAQEEEITREWVENLLENWEEALLPAISRYLNTYHHRFDLIHPELPFMQVADLHTDKGDIKPVSRLILDSESEYFSMRAEKTLRSLSFAEAARALIEVQAYDYSGIKSGAVGDPRVKGGKGYPLGVGWHGTTGKIILHGRNFAETLLLNIDYGQLGREDSDNEGYYYTFDDLPVWERGEENGVPDSALPRAAVLYEQDGGDLSKYKDDPQPMLGMCEVLTWQSRRIRLWHDGNEVTGVLIANGDKWFDRYGPESFKQDPLTAYRWSKNQSSKTSLVWMPKAHSPERTLWRGVDALIAGEPAKNTHPDQNAPNIQQLANGKYLPQGIDHPRIQLVGVVYGNQSAVIEGYIDEEFGLDTSLIQEHGVEMMVMIKEQISDTMEAAISLGQYAGNLLRAAGKEYEFRADATESALHGLESVFRTWLHSLSADSDREKARREWQARVRSYLESRALEMLRNAGAKAIVGTHNAQDNQGYTAAIAYNSFRGRLRKLIPAAYDYSTKN